MRMKVRGWLWWVLGAIIYGSYVIAALPWFASMFGLDRIGRVERRGFEYVLIAYNGIEITEAHAGQYYIGVVCCGLILAAVGLWVMERGDNILDRIYDSPESPGQRRRRP